MVPFSDVGEVTPTRWAKQRIVVQFDRRTDFGQRIVFMPKVRLFAPSSHYLFVAELQAAVAAAKRGASLNVGASQRTKTYP